MARKKKLTPTIAVDFDGTLCRDQFPLIGEPNQPLIDFLIRWHEQGNKVILWTCREDGLLWTAVDWCAEHGLHFDAVNCNLPERIEYYRNDSRKVGADYYIDDFNAFIISDRHEVSPPRKEIWDGSKSEVVV